MRTDVEFGADGTTLRGWLYVPDEGEGRFPAVVMAHGFSAVKEQSLDEFAEVFCRSGLACLVYDHRNLGESDGELRQDIDPWTQVRDYRHAISYARTLPEVDPDRIGIWGTSYSGAHVLVVAAVDRRVKCVVSQVPLISGFRNLQRLVPADQLPGVIKMLEEERTARYEGAEPATLQVCTDDPAVPAAFPEARTHYFFNHYADKAPNWRNECTLRSLDWLMEYDVTPFVGRISPTPLLMVLTEVDNTTPLDIQLQAYELALEPKKVVVLPGDHYAAYIESFELSSAAGAEWLSRHLTRSGVAASQPSTA